MDPVSARDRAQMEAFVVGEDDPADSVAELFWENTKLRRGALAADWDPIADANLEAEAAHIEMVTEAIATTPKHYFTYATVPLRAPIDLAGCDLPHALHSRYSCRDFDSATSISMEELSTLLRYSYGWQDGSRARRFVPSAGGLFSLELYVVSLRVADLAAGGVYHYRPTHHVLEHLRSVRLSDVPELFEASEWVRDASAVVFVSGVLPRVKWKYGERGLRYIQLDAGHLVQNACLVAAALEVGLCPMVGFVDDGVHDFLELDGLSEIVLYSFTVGVPAAPQSHESGVEGG